MGLCLHSRVLWSFPRSLLATLPGRFSWKRKRGVTAGVDEPGAYSVSMQTNTLFCIIADELRTLNYIFVSLTWFGRKSGM